MWRKYTSRKFITALAAQTAAIAVLFWPDQQDAIVEAAQAVAALVALVASGIGYAMAEASVDRAASKEDGLVDRGPSGP